MKKTALLIFSIFIGTTLMSTAAHADEPSRDGASSIWGALVGTWQVEVTVRFDATDCSTSPPVPFGPNPFPSLNTFHAGGTMSETGSRSSPATRSPGHGVWKQSGRKTFDARHTFQGFDANGLLASNMDIRSTITLARDGETFTGVGRLQFSDISGNVQPFCATLEGVRFAL
jgi:hypothetical protein